MEDRIAFNKGWFNCFATFANSGANTDLCQEILTGAGITEDEAETFLNSGECSGQARIEIEDYIARLMRIACGDEDEDGNVGEC